MLLRRLCSVFRWNDWTISINSVISEQVERIFLQKISLLYLERYWMIVAPIRSKYVTFQTAYLSVSLSIFGGLFWAGAPILGW